MTVAKSPEQYEAAWESHITELTCVFLEARIPMDEWDELLRPIRSALQQAVDNLEEQETWSRPSS